MSKRKRNRQENWNEAEDYYDISSARSENKARKKRRNTKDMLRDFTDARNGRSAADEFENLHDYYGDSLEKDW